MSKVTAYRTSGGILCDTFKEYLDREKYYFFSKKVEELYGGNHNKYSHYHRDGFDLNMLVDNFDAVHGWILEWKLKEEELRKQA